jgi:hypothetical protein
MRKILIATIALSCLAAGCGYTTGSLLPSHIKAIHIEPFRNRVNYATEGRRTLYVPLLEVRVRNAVVDRFLFDGNLKVVDENRANVILTGEIVDYQRGGLRFNQEDDRIVEEFRVQIFANLSLWDVKKEEVIWSQTNMAGEATFFTTGPQARSEAEAIEEAITDLARRTVERTIEDW